MVLKSPPPVATSPATGNSPPSTRPNDNGPDGAVSSPRRQGGGRGRRRIPLILGEVELIQQGVDGGRLKPRAGAPPVAAEKRAQEPERVAGGEDVLGPQHEVKGRAVENRMGLGQFVSSEGRRDLDTQRGQRPLHHGLHDREAWAVGYATMRTASSSPSFSLFVLRLSVQPASSSSATAASGSPCEIGAAPSKNLGPKRVENESTQRKGPAQRQGKGCNTNSKPTPRDKSKR